MSVDDLKKDICLYSQHCYNRGLVGAAGGNISARLPGADVIWISPSGTSLRDVTPDSLIGVDSDGNVVQGNRERRPSKETALHLAVYDKRPGANAVIHAHPRYATGYAVAGRTFAMGTASAELKLVEMPLVSSAYPGSPELRANVAAALDKCTEEVHVLLLEKHGILAFEKNLCAAFDMAELAEDTAAVMYVAETLPKRHTLGRRWPRERKER